MDSNFISLLFNTRLLCIAVIDPILTVISSLFLSTLKGYSETLHVRLIQEFAISTAVAHRLAKAYGGRARDVLLLAGQMRDRDDEKKLLVSAEPAPLPLLVPGFPILEAEVVFAARNEWAIHAGGSTVISIWHSIIVRIVHMLCIYATSFS